MPIHLGSRHQGRIVGILAAGCFVATFMLMPSVGHAQADPKSHKINGNLKGHDCEIGSPQARRERSRWR